MTLPAELGACCEMVYSHPVAGWLLGDSLHPGGVELTAKLAGLMGVEGSSQVLDAGSGRGASAVHLAHALGCHVTGITLEDAGVQAGYELAQRRGVRDRVEFVRGDIMRPGPESAAFDFVLMECVLSAIADKEVALDRAAEQLRPGGRLGLSDVTVSGPMPAELQGVLATVGCVGGALSLEGYCELILSRGLEMEHAADCHEVASRFLRDTMGALMMADIAVALGKLPIGASTLAEARRLLESASQQVERRTLSYGLLVARKPA